MMPIKNKYESLCMLFILFLISVMVYIGIYSSNLRNNTFQGTSQRKIGTFFIKQSEVFNDRIILKKDSSIIINNCKLTFRGVKKKMIHLEFCLLDLDPQSAYQYSVSTTDAASGIHIGDSEYEFLSVSRGKLKLKVNKFFRPN